MSDDQPSIPVLGSCRICGERTQGVLTVCHEHGQQVQARMGSVSDWHVREYMRLTKLIKDAPTSLPSKNVEPLRPRPKKFRCSCNQLYSREIVVLACEARGHAPILSKVP